MNQTIKDQILAVRDDGGSNMFDVNGVMRIAYDLEFYELVGYLSDKSNHHEYSQFIMTGEAPMEKDSEQKPEKEEEEEPIKEQSLKDRQKEEASTRLKLLDVPVRIRRDFERFGRIWLCSSPLGSYSDLSDALKEEIEKFEKKYDATVFMVVRAFSRAGLLDSLLYVGKYEEEWEEEKLDINDGYIMTYTINWDHDFCSEFGSIAYHRLNDGGIVRLN